MESLQSIQAHFQELRLEDQQHIRSYLVSVKRSIDLNDPDSKNMLAELSRRMSSAQIADGYPLLRRLLNAVFEYLRSQNADASLEGITTAVRVIERESTQKSSKT